MGEEGTVTIDNYHPDFSTRDFFECLDLDGSCSEYDLTGDDGIRNEDDSEDDWVRYVRFRINELRDSDDPTVQARYRYACPDEGSVWCYGDRSKAPWIGSPPDQIELEDVELSGCDAPDDQGLCLEIWSEKIVGGVPEEVTEPERFDETRLEVELPGATCVGRAGLFDICVRNCAPDALPEMTGLDRVSDPTNSPNDNEFIYLRNSCSENTILVENDHCCFQVEFYPEYHGPRTASVVIDFEGDDATGNGMTGIEIAMTGNNETRNTEAGLINVAETVFFEPMPHPDGNCTHEGQLIISNVGCGDLHIEVPFQIEGNESFEDTVDLWPFGEDLTLPGATEVMEGGSHVLTLRYCPLNPETDREDGILLIESDDPDNGEVRVTLDNPNW
jgi:hypothetical protein